MASSASVPYSALWTFFTSRDEYDPDNAREVQLSVYRQIVESMPSLTINDMTDLMTHAPSEAQQDMWSKWSMVADTMGYSLIEWNKSTRSLSPAILVIVWSAWCAQNDINDYPYKEAYRVVSRLPKSVLAAVAGLRPRQKVVEIPLNRTPRLETRGQQ